MKRLVLVVMVLLAMSAMTVSISFGANVLMQKSGLNYIDTSTVQDGYPMFYSSYDGKACMIMIDLYCNLVHYWTSDNTDYTMTSLAWPLVWSDGSLIVDAMYNKDKAVEPISLVRGARNYDVLLQVDWSSNLSETSGFGFLGENYAPHHDGKKIWNSALGQYTWLALGWWGYGADDAVALGVDPAYEGNYGNGWSPDCLLETDGSGDLIWRWSFADHLVQYYDDTKVAAFTDTYGFANPGATYGEPADYPGKLNVNCLSDNNKGPSSDWNHCNSIDFNPGLGHIVVNAKDFSEVYVIDHDGTFVSTEDWDANFAAAQTDDGDFLYRFGNPSVYNQGEFGGYNDDGDHQFWGAHNIHWIGTTGSMYPGWEVFGELPGEGNFLLFDNNCWDPTEHASNVLEWNPFLTYDETTEEVVDTGWYVNPPDAGYQAAGFGMGFGSGNSVSTAGYSNQVVWRFNGGTGFYGFHISGMQRMPNGNTHVCEGTQSHLFECTTSGNVSWEYYKPQTNSEYSGGSTFRSNKLPVGHPALDGRTLTPQGNFRDLLLEAAAGASDAATELQKFLGTF